MVISLNVDPGGCHAAEARAERGHRRLLDGQRDRGAQRRRLVRAGALEHARARDELAARRPEQVLVEDSLEARHADLGVGGHAERGELLAALGRDRAELADHLRGEQRGRRALVALGQHGAVAGEQRRARGHPGDASQALARGESGEDQRARPVDAVPGRRQDDLALDGAEGAGGDAHADAVGAPVLARLGRVDVRGRRGAQRLLVGGREARARHAVAVVRGELGVHRRVVAALPGGREALGVGLAGRRVARAHDHADDEGEAAERQDRDEALLRARGPAPRRRRARCRWPARARGRSLAPSGPPG